MRTKAALRASRPRFARQATLRVVGRYADGRAFGPEGGRVKGIVIVSALVIAAVASAPAPSAQNTTPRAPQATAPAPNADPYANSAAAGTTKFPLAAPAGMDSKAMTRFINRSTLEIATRMSLG